MLQSMCPRSREKHTLGRQTGWVGCVPQLGESPVCDLGKERNLTEAGSPLRNGASAEHSQLGVLTGTAE